MKTDQKEKNIVFVITALVIIIFLFAILSLRHWYVLPNIISTALIQPYVREAFLFTTFRLKLLKTIINLREIKRV